VSASTAALISLRHRDELMETVERITEERQQLFRGLQSISYLIPYPSQTNFILCRLLDRNARQIRDELAHRGILIRHYDEPNLMNTLRISVGKPEHTQAILTALREWE
jgi:histidinol-phosphate aminotransferase